MVTYREGRHISLRGAPKARPEGHPGWRAPGPTCNLTSAPSEGPSTFPAPSMGFPSAPALTPSSPPGNWRSSHWSHCSWRDSIILHPRSAAPPSLGISVWPLPLESQPVTHVQLNATRDCQSIWTRHGSHQARTEAVPRRPCDGDPLRTLTNR